MQSVEMFIQLGIVIEIDYIIIDDGGWPGPSDSKSFKIWWEENIVLNSGKHYNQ